MINKARRRTIYLTYIIILSFLILAMILFLFRPALLREFSPAVPKAQGRDLPEKKKLPCILCGSPLELGENLKSEEYKGEDESVVKIFGCPYCYGEQAVRTRRCPVCKRVMPGDGYLTGRMWKTRKGKMHLHVSGCTECGRRKVNRSGF